MSPSSLAHLRRNRKTELASVWERKPARQAVRRMLAHLTSAARHVGDGSVSRREARRLIRFAGCCDDFAELQRRASQYRGLHNKIVRGINDRKARERAREIWLDDDHSVLELKTVSQQRSVGKRLRNCIGGHLGGDYRDALRRGESEFWALRYQGEDVGLLCIDSESRKIEECAGVDNEPVGWGRCLLLDLQRVLDATGDKIEEFVESGAFSMVAVSSQPCGGGRPKSLSRTRRAGPLSHGLHTGILGEINPERLPSRRAWFEHSIGLRREMTGRNRI